VALFLFWDCSGQPPVICNESDEVSIRMGMSSTRDVQNHAEKTSGSDASVCIMYCGIFGHSVNVHCMVNRVCVEPEDWRLLSSTLNSLKGLLWMLGSLDDWTRATCLE
jgi:hypothetical protein